MPPDTQRTYTELGNIASALDPQELTKIGSVCYKDYKEDCESRAEWLQIHAEYMKIYNQMDYPDTPPWDGACKESLPIMTEACNQYQARAYKAFFPSRNFVSAIPQDESASQNNEAADRVAKHMSHQLSFQDRSYKPDKNAMFLATSMHGSDFTKTYFNPVTGTNKVDRVRAVDLIVPYGKGPRRIDEIERKSQVIWMSENRSKVLASKKYFLSPLKPCRFNEQGDPIQMVEDDLQGLHDSNPYRLDRPCCVIEQHRLLDLDKDGLAEPYIVWFDVLDKTVKRIQVRYEMDSNGNAIDEKKPIEYYTHYPFLINPDGFYGLGMGHLLGKLNVAANKILRQIVDAGSLANIGNMSGFISEQLGIHGDYVELELGLFKKLPRTVQDINKAIYQFQFPGPNAAYMETMRFIQETAQRLGATTEAMTGDVEKVVQPLALLTMLDSSLQLPTSIMEGQALAFEDELEKLYNLNRKYFQGDYIIQDEDMMFVKPEDYQENYKIIPIIDPKQITRQQKTAKAQALYQFVLNDPILSQNRGSVEEASTRMLQALDPEDVDKILAKPQPENIDDQLMENMFYMLPPADRPLFDVFPEQDHIKHIAEIDALMSMLNHEIDPEVNLHDPKLMAVMEGMTEQIKSHLLMDLIEHRQKHVAYLYGLETGVLSGQGLNQGMAAPPSNAMVFAQPQPTIPLQPMGTMQPRSAPPPSGQSGGSGFPTNSTGILGNTKS